MRYCIVVALLLLGPCSPAQAKKSLRAADDGRAVYEVEALGEGLSHRSLAGTALWGSENDLDMSHHPSPDFILEGHDVQGFVAGNAYSMWGVFVNGPDICSGWNDGVPTLTDEGTVVPPCPVFGDILASGYEDARCMEVANRGRRGRRGRDGCGRVLRNLGGFVAPDGITETTVFSPRIPLYYKDTVPPQQMGRCYTMIDDDGMGLYAGPTTPPDSNGRMSGNPELAQVIVAYRNHGKAWPSHSSVQTLTFDGGCDPHTSDVDGLPNECPGQSEDMLVRGEMVSPQRCYDIAMTLYYTGYTQAQVQAAQAAVAPASAPSPTPGDVRTTSNSSNNSSKSKSKSSSSSKSKSSSGDYSAPSPTPPSPTPSSSSSCPTDSSGWTKVMSISGSSTANNAWNYDHSVWTDGQPRSENGNAKFSAFDNCSVGRVKLVFDGRAIDVRLSRSYSSLGDMFRGSEYTSMSQAGNLLTSSTTELDWRNLAPGGAPYQHNCFMQGYNLVPGNGRRARFGALWNNSSSGSCTTVNSAIAIGMSDYFAVGSGAAGDDCSGCDLYIETRQSDGNWSMQHANGSLHNNMAVEVYVRA